MNRKLSLITGLAILAIIPPLWAQEREPPREMEVRERQMQMERRQAELSFENEMRKLQLEQKRVEIDRERQSLGMGAPRFMGPFSPGACPMRMGDRGPGPMGCVAFLMVAAIVHTLMAIWVYQDVRKRNGGAYLWVPIAFLTGFFGTLVYALIRLGDKPAQ